MLRPAVSPSDGVHAARTLSALFVRAQATQQSVLHFEVSRMSRSQSAIKFDAMASAASQSAAASNATTPEPGSGVDPGSFYSAASDAGARTHDASGVSAAAGASGLGGGVSGVGADGAPLSAEDQALHATWERMRKASGVLEPIDLVHKALDQLNARTEVRARLAIVLTLGS